MRTLSPQPPTGPWRGFTCQPPCARSPPPGTRRQLSTPLRVSALMSATWPACARIKDHVLHFAPALLLKALRGAAHRSARCSVEVSERRWPDIAPLLRFSAPSAFGRVRITNWVAASRLVCRRTFARSRVGESAGAPQIQFELTGAQRGDFHKADAPWSTHCQPCPDGHFPPFCIHHVAVQIKVGPPGPPPAPPISPACRP